jgi:hypothetical protein
VHGKRVAHIFVVDVDRVAYSTIAITHALDHLERLDF